IEWRQLIHRFVKRHRQSAARIVVAPQCVGYGGSTFLTSVPRFENCLGTLLREADGQPASIHQNYDDGLASIESSFEQVFLRRRQVDIGAVAAREPRNVNGGFFSFQTR